MAQQTEVARAIVHRLRTVCLDLPEAYEEQAWVGTRWCVRKQTFAHVLVIDNGWPPVYAKTFTSDGPTTVLTFQSSGDELAAFSNLGHPFYRPAAGHRRLGPWRKDRLDRGRRSPDGELLPSRAAEVGRAGQPTGHVKLC